MKKFIEKHTQKITGTIACFDRLIFKGYLPISWAESMERFMTSRGLLIKDFLFGIKKPIAALKQRLYVPKFVD